MATAADRHRTFCIATAVVAIAAASVRPAQAEWFVTPFIGLKFAGDTNFVDLEQGAGNTKVTLGAAAGFVELRPE